MEKNLFEIAARERYRFPFNGQITTEDLFMLSAVNLDKVYKTLTSERRKSENDGDSLLSSSSAADKVLDNKIDIVKYIFEYKQALSEKAKKSMETRKRNEKILDLIERKKDAELEGKSIEDLEKMLVSDSE